MTSIPHPTEKFEHMKKFINTVEDLLDDSLQGFALAHADILRYNKEPRYVARRSTARPGKVALISGGGSGHEPLHTGFVGSGMLDAACPGQIFTSPTPDQMLAAAECVDHGGGILFIVKNFAGDVMNFEMAAEMLTSPNATVLVHDDVSLPEHQGMGRRGVAGTTIVEKMLGAAAEVGWDLARCQQLGQKIVMGTATMGVALTSCTVPALGHPTFELGENEMEMGVGIHGEKGRERKPLAQASEIVDTIASILHTELNLSTGERVLLHVNGFGATPAMEFYLIYQLAHRFCTDRGLDVTRSLVGNFTTSLDMAGCSITLTRLDDELIRLWDAPVHTAALRWGG